MALNKITYDDKNNYQTSSLADIYKVTADDMNEIKTVVNDVVDSTTYDASEIPAGTWIDDKTIYKTTFTGNLPTIIDSNWTTVLNISSLNISELIDIEGMCGNGKLPRYSNSSYFVDIQLAGNNIQVMGLGYSNQPYKITLYYTKTS